MTQRQIPVEVIFAPDWWHHHYGIAFNRTFYFDRDTRIECDQVMRRALHERFGLGEPDPQPRPIIGPRHVAGGFVIPALLGLEIRFSADAAPWPVPAGLSREQVLALEVPELGSTWPMRELLADLDNLGAEWGYALGDVDTDGVLNTALHLRGEQLFADFYKDPEVARHLLAVVAETTALVARCFRSHTGSCAVATNRSILRVDPALYLHSNCSVQMVSPALFEEFLLPHELYLAEQLQPYGIHHCGDNLHRFAGAYSRVPLSFLDVGWGSDVAQVRAAFPGVFLNLRLSPGRMLDASAEEIREDTRCLLRSAGHGGPVGVCCINMDAGTPDQNVGAMLDAVASFRADSRSGL
jgi:hypothetical protein